MILRRHRDEPTAEPTTEPTAGTDAAGQLQQLRDERAALIELVLYARDRASSPAVADRIDGRLAELGVRTVRPDGEAFDPARHEAGGSEPTDDAALHNVVAATEQPGFSDRGEAVRPPIVSVYQRNPKDQP